MRKWQASEHRVYGVAFSPDGKWVATGDTHHVIQVWAAAGGPPKPREGAWVWCWANREHTLAWSPDGGLIVAVGVGTGLARVVKNGKCTELKVPWSDNSKWTSGAA